MCRLFVTIFSILFLSCTYAHALVDSDPPTVVFTLPESSNSLVIAITSFTATDNVAVTGYKVTLHSTPPAASATGWSAAPPASYTVSSSGSKKLYAWAKDGAGNVSNSSMAVVTVFAPIITAGNTQSLIVQGDGSLWAWGGNLFGQLGDGSTANRTVPTRIVTGTANSWKSVSAAGGGTTWGNSEHTVAIQNDGSLWAWGRNNFVQLGWPTNPDYSTSPILIYNSKQWQIVAANALHTCAIQSDGSLWSWGDNTAGQLGDGTNTRRTWPTRIGSSLSWRSVAEGKHLHTGAIQADGSLWAWGYNYHGQLGDGTTTDRNTPTRIGTDSNWENIAVGTYHTVAIKSDGSLWAWGRNNFGQLGDGTAVDKTIPTRIGTADNWQSVAAGFSHTVAIQSDGSLWAWGLNNAGQLGDGTTSTRTVPTRIGTISKWQSVAAGFFHTVARQDDDSLWAWGANGNGEVGDGTTISRSIPTGPIDFSAPTGGSIVINGGLSYTSNNVVTLTLAASDVEGNLSQMRFSLDNVSWSAWEDYGTSRSYTLPLGDGIKNLYVQYRDTFGHISSTYNSAIILDTLAPSGSVVLNNSDAISNLSTMTATLNATDESGITQMQFSWDNVTWDAWEAFAVTKSVTANDGDGIKSLYVRFKDGAGNVSVVVSDSILTMIDSDGDGILDATEIVNGTDPHNPDITAPDLVVSTLAHNARTNNTALNVSGTVSDGGGLATLTVNSDAVTVSGGAFSTLIALAPGDNSLTVTAFDLAGNRTSDSRTIVLDQTAPQITLATPADNSKTALSAVVVSGSVDENATVEVVDESGAVHVPSRDGMSFSSVLLLVEGLNTLTVNAQDVALNSASAKRTVTYDPTAPSLAVTSPAEDIIDRDGEVTISGTVSDALTNVTVTVSVDGIDYTPVIAADGSFSQAISLNAEGLYPVTVSARDEADNVTSVTRNLIYAIHPGGDANRDGLVTSTDAMLVLKMALGLIPPDLECDVAPLVSGVPQPDGKITSGDALVILRRAVGLVNW